jgi:GT2 family glycosyltransferase
MFLSVIIISFNSRDLLVSCLNALDSAVTGLEHEVVVVDNASTDGSVQAVRSGFPHVKVIANRENLGFARAANQGFRATTGRYVLLLNPDVTVNGDSVQSMVAFMEGTPDVGLLLPKLLNPDGTLQLSCRTFYNLEVMMLRRTPLGRVFPDSRAVREHLMADWDHADTREVDWGLGAAMFIRRVAVKDGAQFDERYFLYFEDVDLCLELKSAGWKVIYFPQAAFVHHHLRQSASGLINRAKYEHLRSLVKFWLKHRGLRP